MKLLVLYSCLLAILFQAIFASLSLNDQRTPLKSKKSGRPKKVKSVGDKSAKRKAAVMKPSKEEGAGKSDKRSTVSTEDKPKSLSEMLPKPLVEIVIGYWGAYSILVSTHSWLLKEWPQIAVDGARLYVMTNSEGLKGLNHLSASLEESERRYIEFGDPQWTGYWRLTSSHDGLYVSFSHGCLASTDLGEQAEDSSKWFIQGNKLESEKPKRVAFDGEDSSSGLLSRNGQTLCSYCETTRATRVYRIVEAGRDLSASLKFELDGILRAVSSNGDRIMVANEDCLEVHDIGKDASKLVCRIGINLGNICALNEDGSEAAYVNDDKELRVMKVDKAIGDKVDHPVIFTVEVPESSGDIDRLVYSDDNRLHVLHNGGKVSFFDPLTETLVPIEAPERGYEIIRSAVSPNADYVATLRVLKAVKGKTVFESTTIFETIVKRKPTEAEWIRFL